ncbi:hypothetical protein [Corynebacterium ulcerans]|nr:hypothetical protein [Corynebacterium ulcerans]
MPAQPWTLAVFSVVLVLFVYGYAGYVDLGTAKPVAGKTDYW